MSDFSEVEDGVVDFGVKRPVRFFTMSEISINAFSRKGGDIEG
jgi:hypothetical protein